MSVRRLALIVAWLVLASAPLAGQRGTPAPTHERWVQVLYEGTGDPVAHALVASSVDSDVTTGQGLAKLQVPTGTVAALTISYGCPVDVAVSIPGFPPIGLPQHEIVTVEVPSCVSSQGVRGRGRGPHGGRGR